MIDFEYKSLILNTDLPKIQRQVSQALFFNTFEETKSWTKFSKQEAFAIQEAYRNLDLKAWHEAEKINHASFTRTGRLRKRIESMLVKGNSNKQFNCLFLTLTFSDSTLENTSKETRRKYVARYLKENCFQYVANVDYGEKNEREHYHAVVLVEGKLDYTKWSYGSLNGEKIRFNDGVEERLAKYVSKLSNHAIKNTTRQSKVIYSRN